MCVVCASDLGECMRPAQRPPEWPPPTHSYALSAGSCVPQPYSPAGWPGAAQRPVTHPWPQNLEAQGRAASSSWTGPWPQQPQSVPLEALNCDCLRATAQIVARGEFATVEAVASAACTLHGASNLEQLGASVASVPTLATLEQIERCVCAYLASFFATHGIATLSDFEAEVVGVLRSHCVRPLPPPPASALASRGASAANSEEIDIDEGSGDDASAEVMPMAQAGEANGAFDRYRVGPLATHPAVRAAWRPAAECWPLSYVDVSWHLLDFLREQQSGRLVGPPVDVDPEAFERWAPLPLWAHAVAPAVARCLCALCFRVLCFRVLCLRVRGTDSGVRGAGTSCTPRGARSASCAW